MTPADRPVANATTTTCKDCPAPITLPARGRRKVFCAACAARRQLQANRKWRAAGSPEKRAALSQYEREWRASRTPAQREAKAQSQREWAAVRTPEQRAARAPGARERWLQRNYGLGVAEFDARLDAQGGTCAVATCTRTRNENGSALHVDHDHSCCPGKRSCGKCVRWLLCLRHNIILGLVNDDPAELRAVVDMLTSWSMSTPVLTSRTAGEYSIDEPTELRKDETDA